MTISTLCFVHCMITPVFLISLPWVGQYFHDPVFHIVIFLVVVPVGLYAFWQGHRHHKNLSVLAIGVPGLLMVGLGAFIPTEVTDIIGKETMTIVGSLFLLTAHYLNWRSCRKHSHIR